MKPTDLKKLIEARFKAKVKRALHIESSPGIGKTAIARQAAKELGVGFKFIHAPLLQPEDYGFPVVSKDKDDVDFIVSKHKFPIEGSDCPATGVFLIDEMPQGDASVQKILANLVQEREIHGHKIKDGWMIISTGNRSTDRAGANRLLSHLRNKITTIGLEVSLDDWCAWAIENDVSAEVIGFIRFRPELLNDFDAQHEINPTPRAWVEGVSKALGVVPPELEFETFKGDVGEAAAAEFVGFLRLFRKMPSIDAIFLDPAKATLPQEGKEQAAVTYAICGALAEKTTKHNFSRVMTYVNRLQPEFQLLYIRTATSTRKCPELQNTKEFIKWASGAGAKLLS